jgi:membrane-associated protein
MTHLIDIFMHLDVHLSQLTQDYGILIYVLLFFIIFAETGLVVAPFLPGDSLLFAVGALAALPDSAIHIGTAWILLIMASFLGDNVNYQIGKYLGPKIFQKTDSIFLNPENLKRTQDFYAEYGYRTVLFARFVPIIRTFAPFVAGVGRMEFKKYLILSLAGALLWMTTFLGAGYFFGNIPAVKSQFHYVILAVLVISFLPVVLTLIKGRFGKAKAS